MIFFFDCETNGLIPTAVDRAEISEVFKEYPRIWQIAYIVATEDGEIREQNVFCLKTPYLSGKWEKGPDHPYEIDEMRCMNGEAQHLIFPIITKLMHAADLIVCHNLRFDSRIFESEMYRLKAIDPATEMPPKKSEGKPKICTMMASTKHCNLPFPSGKKGTKFPQLQELHAHLFGDGYSGAHDALADVKATAKCFFELRRLGIIPESL